MHVKLFFGMVNLDSFHNKFFFCLRTLGLKVTNTPGTANVLGLNLTGPGFFKREIFHSKKLSIYYLSADVLSA